MSEALLDISKTLKCSVCGKYIISYEELHKYNTCSRKCYNQKYNHDYYLRVTKNERRNKR